MKRDILKLVMGVVMLAGVWLLMRYVVKGAMEVMPVGTMADTGYVVVIDAGHGGVDPGVLGIGGIQEKDINLIISLKLKALLEEQGIRVVMTRETDAGLYSENDTNKKMADMKARCAIIEEENADMVVSIHQNSFSDPKVSGAQVFYYTHSEEGALMAQSVQDSIRENVDETNLRKIKGNDTYYMLLHTSCPTIIVECGFVTNEEEAALLVTEEYQDAVADAITKGIIEYLSDK